MGEYFTPVEFKIIKELTLKHHNESELAKFLISFQPIMNSKNRSNQLLDKFIALIPLLHTEILNTNSSWAAKNLHFLMQSSISDYLSRTNISVFDSIRPIIEPRTDSELSYDQMSQAQFEIANLKSRSRNTEATEFVESAQRLNKRFHETQLEVEVTVHYNSLFRHFRKTASLKNEYAEEALTYYNKYAYLLESTKNMKLYFFVSLIGIMYALFKPDYQLVVHRSERTLDNLLHGFDIQNQTYIRAVRNRLIEAYIQTGQYDEALCELNKTGSQHNLVSRVRQALLRILIYLRGGQYLEAVQLLLETDTPYVRKKLAAGIKYNFVLTRNLVYIIAALNEMDSQYLPAKRTLTSMLNVDSEFFLDKSGLNLAQIVTKWVLLIMNRDTDRMERRDLALSKYLARHVRDKKNYRAKCMLRMLRMVHISNYNIKVIKIRTKISYNRLKQTKPDGTFQAMELEIIPYEQLWDLLLKYIANDKRMYPK